MGKTFNTGYLQNIIQYDGSNNIILPSLIGTGTRIVVAAANGTLSSQTASTTNIAEGTNLYYTDARVATYLSANTYATQSYVTTAVSNLVDAAPGTLNTLNELAAALGDDPNFATTVATSIGTKQAQLNGTGFVKVSGTTVSYDNSTYLTTSSASSTYVPYTGATSDLVLGANNFSSKRVSVLKSSDGFGGFTSNYLFLQTGSSTTSVGTDGISLLSKPNTRALVINYDIGGTNYGATLDASLLTNSRTFEFPNASGVLALTSNIPTLSSLGGQPALSGTGFVKISGTTISYDNSTYLTTASATSTYLPLAGGIMSGNISYGVGNGVAWYLQPQAVGGGPTNGAVLRLRSHSAAGALTDRSGALAWIDGNGVRLDIFEWNSSLINAYVPINGTSAVFSSTVNINSTLYAASAATIAYNGLSGDFGTGYSTGLGVGYSSTVGKGINIGWNTTLDAGFIGSVHNGTGWKSLILSPIGGAVYIGATGNNDLYAGTATFSSTVNVGGNLNLTSTYPRINLTDTNNNSDYSIINADGIFSIYDNTVGTNRLTISALGASTFLNTLNSVGLLTGQASIYQSDAGGLIASNRWGVYNGGATTMRFLYNASGAVIWDNGSDRMTLNALGRLIVGDIGDNGARIQTSGDIRADYSSSIYLEINGGAVGDYRKGFSGVNQLTGVARGLHLFNYDPDSSQGIKFYGGSFASKVRFGGFDNGGNFFVNSTDSAEGYKLYVNGSAGVSGNLTINNTLSSPGNLIETAGLNIYLRPAAGYTVFIDTGNGLSTNALDITGDVRYRGSIYDSFNFVASGNYTSGTYYNIVGVNIIPTGIYIIEGLIDTFAAGGGIYFMRFASVPFFMWDVGSNSTTFVDLPPVLGTGHHLGNQFPSFRLQQTLAGAGIYLQFTPNSTWAGIDNSGGKAFRVNLKRIG